MGEELGEGLSLEELIPISEQLIKGIIDRPRPSEKLLKRPPFRFIYDVVMKINEKTKFIEGLLDEEEYSSENIKSRDAKVKFLNKIIQYVGLFQGKHVNVKVQKIVAGHEPENTNIFLQGIVKAAEGPEENYSQIVQDVLAGKNPGESRESKSSEEEQKPRETHSRKSSRKEKPVEPEPNEEKEDDGEEAKQQDDNKSTRNSEGLEENNSSSIPDASQADGEVETSVTLFDGLIKRPKMSEKLLSRPPFRFIHDVMTNLNSATGFIEGLIPEELQDSRQISDRDGKMGYVNLIVGYVACYYDIPPPAKAGRIIAGQEAENTNKLLQLVALIGRQILDNNGNNSYALDVVQRVKNGDDTSSKKKAASEPVQDEPRSVKRESTLETGPEEKTDQRVRKSDSRESERRKKAERSTKKETEDENKEEEEEEEEEEVHMTANEPKRMARPQTARKRPPKIRENRTEVETKTNTNVNQARAVGVMMDGEDDDSDDEEDDETAPLRSDRVLNPALDNEPRGKLVRDILNEEKENEEKDDESKERSKSGISLGKIGQGLRKPGAGSIASIQIDDLRVSVQNLCQSTNPLSKCVDYIHDDMSIMTKELEQWKTEYQNNCDALDEEKRGTAEALQPLSAKLHEVDEKIKDQQAKIQSVKASITKNDLRISELMRDMVLK